MCTDYESYEDKCIYDKIDETDLENCEKCTQNTLIKYQTCNQCDDISRPYVYDNDLNIIRCTTYCPMGKFMQNNKCEDCLDQCKKCITKSYCQYCITDWYLSVDNDECVQECGPQQYLMDKNNKIQCKNGTVKHCIQYQKYEDKCMKCEGKLVILDILSKTECIGTCPDYFYANYKTGYCEQCYNKLCLRCSGNQGSLCQLCEADSTLEDHQCLKNCQSGYFRFNFTQCKQCARNCKECSDKETQCTECFSNQLYYENWRICKDGERCDIGFYQSDGNKCYNCISQCLDCKGKPNFCTQCESNLVLQYNTCQQLCDQGNGLRQNTNICIFCEDFNCYICTNFYQNCEVCMQGFITVKQQDGLSKCKRCHRTCFTCFGIQNNECYSCIEGYIFDKDKTQCIANEKIEDEPKNSSVGTIILFTCIGIGTIIIGIVLYCILSKQKKKYLKKEILLKNDILQELEQQYNFQANENIIFNEENIKKFNILHLQHEMTELQFKQQFKRIKNLGQGSFGVVEQFYDKMNDQDVAIKFFKTLKSNEILDLGLKEAENIERINKQSQEYTIQLLSYFIIQCESVQNSIQRYQEQNNKPRKIKSCDSNKGFDFNNNKKNDINLNENSNSPKKKQKQKLQNSNIQNDKNKNQNQQKPCLSINNNLNNKTDSTSSHSNYDSLFDSIKNDSYTLFLNKQQKELEQKETQQNINLNNKTQNLSKNKKQKQNISININKEKNVQQNINKSQQNDDSQIEFQKMYENTLECQKNDNQIDQEPVRELAIVFEMADYTLADKISKKRLMDQAFTKQEVIIFLHNMTSVLFDFHQKMHLSHRDIKPQNILFVKNCWKLADFGMSKFLDQHSSITNNYTLTGTLNYQSPEQKNNYVNQLSSIPQLAIPLNPFKCDIFSLGITCYEIVTLKKVDNLNQNQHFMSSCLNKFLKPCIEYYGKEIIEVIELMLEWELDKRFSIDKIKEKVDNILELNKQDQLQNNF